MKKLVVLGLGALGGLAAMGLACNPGDVLRNQGSSLTSTDYVGDAVRKQQYEAEQKGQKEAAQREELNRVVSGAQAHVDLFEYKAAIVDWKDAYRISNDPIYLLRLAESDRAVGDCAEAQQMYQQYLDKKPGAPDDAQVKQRLAEAKTCQTRAGSHGEEARHHYDTGVTHYELSEYEPAVKEFKEAYRLSNDPAYLFNIAQSYRLERKCTDAMQFYQRYLSAAGDIPNKDKVQARIDEMRACAK